MTDHSEAVTQESARLLVSLSESLQQAHYAVAFLADTFDGSKQTSLEAVRLATDVSRISEQYADQLVNLAQQGPARISLPELAHVRRIAVNTLRQRVPSVPSPPATGAANQPPY